MDPDAGPASAAPADLPVFERWALATGALRGWRRGAVALALGLLSAAALPPVHAVPVLLVAFPGLVWLLDGAQGWRRAFADGWWFGFGHFLGGLYWIANSLLVDAAQWAWLLPFAVAGIPAILAFYIAGVAVLARLAPSTPSRVLLLGCAWLLAEWLRGQLFTGFPWNPVGSVWAFSDAAIQPAALIGVFGLGFVTVIAAASPAALRLGGGVARWLLPALGGALVAAIFAYGAARLPDGPAPLLDGPVLRVVQPNIPQHLKWRPEFRAGHVRRILSLSRRPGDRPVTHLVWPETAIPVIPSIDPAARQAIATVVPPGGLVLTGAVRRTQPGVTPVQVWNSVHAIDASGRIVATYDKFHLVPFGEYMPLGKLLGLSKITAGRTDFSAGPGPRTLEVPGLPSVSPLICYEVIFPGEVIADGDAPPRPRWLLNVTNDAWFGHSAGPYQHLVAARFRATEEGIPLVRAANTGISAIVDPYGRVIARIGLGRQGSIDSGLPQPIPSGTLYATMGDFPLLAGSLLSVFVIAGFRRKNF